jgi:predicted ATP-grasp superfamily ATP-dependent carboligase
VNTVRSGAVASRAAGAGDTPAPSVARTLGALGLLTCALPVNLTLTAAALLRGAIQGLPERADPGAGARTVLISGGKMTKALALARAFHRAGHRVVLVESGHYRFTGHRFSRAVDAFHVVPPAGAPGYGAAMIDVVRREGVDVYVPVCSPASAAADAEIKAALEEHCEVLHFAPEMLARLDDKEQFAATAAALGLPVPDAHRITDPEQVLDFDFGAGSPPYVLKSIAYDPIRRLDLTRLPQADAGATRAFVESLPVSTENPWVMQSFVEGQEYCTHSTARNGRVQLHCCCESSAFQLNYAMVDIPEIEAWVQSFVAALGLTGQVSLDFIRGQDGRYYAIECNPRTHSAITMFYDQPGVAAAFLETTGETLTPTAQSRPSYWLYHELWRALSHPRSARGPLARIRAGKEAIFAWDDPLPFLLVHHLQIPSLLLSNLRRGGSWTRIDFNIGKLVEPGGD